MKRFLIFVISALSLSGLSAAIFYVLSKKDEDDFEPPVIITEQIQIKVKIPKELVGVFIGRGGANIRKIQEECKARVLMDPEYTTDDEFRECTIFGSATTAQHAETLIHEFIMKQPKIESHELRVPEKYIGRIIGRKGETIRCISRNSSAKIIVEDDRAAEEGKITIKGTSDQIDLACKLLSDIMEGCDEAWKEQTMSIQNRSPRVKPKTDSNSAPVLQPPVASPGTDLCPPGGDQSWEVFVSALESPSQFWVQVINERATKLDELTDEMTEYYSMEESRQLHKISDLSVGKIVAAPFSEDGKYYRARVTSILCDEKLVQVFFVDYGDSSTLDESQVLELRTDYLTLRYQAIECFLADVTPGCCHWSEEAIDLFDNLAEVALWKRKRAVFKTYRSLNQVEKSPYAVQLFAMNGDELISIGQELIKQGFAVGNDEWQTSVEGGGDDFDDTSTARQYSNAVPELSDSGSDIDGFYFN